MSESVKVSFIFNDKNYHGAYAAHLKYRQKKWIVVRSILCVCMIAFGGYLMTTSSSEKMFGYAFVTAGSVGVLRPMVWQMWHERGIRKHSAYGSKLKFIFSEGGIDVDGKAGKVHLGWDQIEVIHRAKRGVLIYYSKGSYFWIPKNLLDEEKQKRILVYLRTSLSDLA